MYAPPPKPHTMLPIAGGALLLVAGILSIADWAMILLNPDLMAFLAFIPGATGIVLICGAIGIIFCLLAIIGGIMAILRKMWALALVGSILGLLTIGPFFMGSLLSLIALILIAISRHEF